MAIIKNCEIYFAKLNPKYPNRKFNKENPTWEIQIQTRSKEQKKEWADLGLPVGVVVPDDDSQPYFKVNLKRRSKDKKGEPVAPVKVVDGALNEIDPDTIGNGSVGNVRIFQYTYKKQDGSDATASILTSIQITKHVVLHRKPGEEFEMTETEVIDEQNDGEDDEEEFETQAKSPAVNKKKAEEAF